MEREIMNELKTIFEKYIRLRSIYRECLEITEELKSKNPPNEELLDLNTMEALIKRKSEQLDRKILNLLTRSYERL